MAHDYCTCGADRGSCIDCAENKIDHLTAQLAEAKGSITKHIEAKDKACTALMNQLAERDAEIEVKQRVLDEHYGVAAICNELVNENASIRTKLAECEKEVERLKEVQGICEVCEVEAIKHADKARKQAAREILKLLDNADWACSTYEETYYQAVCAIKSKFELEG